MLTDELYAKATGARRPRLAARRRSGTGRLTADRQRLTQAVMQLAQNAAQHTRDGDRDRARLARSTTACASSGSPTAARASRPASASAIFERFHRGGDGRRRSDGAGLGLAIVRAIAEAHGGRVELDSRDEGGRGATFTLIVPTEPPQEEAR